MWNDVVRETLKVKKGGALFISTPWGHNHFRDLYLMGDPNSPTYNPQWASFHFSQYDSPLITKEDIELSRQTMPERAFNREVMGLFVEDGGEVFRGVRTAIAEKFPEQLPLPDCSYVIGIDWGRAQDFTVAVVLNEMTRQQVDMIRINDDLWEDQLRQVKDLINKWVPRLVVVELNSVGESNYQVLRSEGLPVIGFMMTASNKNNLIDAWNLRLSRTTFNF